MIFPACSTVIPGAPRLVAGAFRCIQACHWHSQACHRHYQMLTGAPNVSSGALRCSETYYNHLYGTSIAVVGDPRYSEGWQEFFPRVWNCPEIDTSKFSLVILSDTPGGLQWLQYILLMMLFGCSVRCDGVLLIESLTSSVIISPCSDRVNLQMHTEAVIGWTRTSYWSEMRDTLHGRTRASFKIITWRPWLSEPGGCYSVSLELHLETMIEWARRYALRGHDSVNVESVIEWVWGYTCRPSLGEIGHIHVGGQSGGGSLGGRRDWSRDFIHWLTYSCENGENWVHYGLPRTDRLGNSRGWNDAVCWVCRTQDMRYPVGALLSVWFTQCILYSVCAWLSRCCSRCMVCLVSAVLSVCSTQCILNSVLTHDHCMRKLARMTWLLVFRWW